MTSVKALLDRAKDETGLDDFGNEYFMEGLTKLVEGVNQEVPLTEMGRIAFDGDMTRILANRLLIQRDFKKHPEIFDEDISDPIIILGLVRSGTSKMQLLVGADPQIRSFKAWQVMFPGRMVENDDRDKELRFGIAKQVETMLHSQFPEFMAGHPVYADQVEEETPLFELSFTDYIHWLRTPCNSFLDWCMTAADDDSYDYMVKVLQYLQWQDGGRQGKRLVLKTPLHMNNLPLVMKHFPKATIVHCHRDINEAVRSWVRLQDLGWSIRVNEPSIEECRRSTLDVWAGVLRKFLRAREAMGDKLNIVDVRYEEIRDDPIKAVRRVYAAAGIELTAEGTANILSWNQRNPQHKAGKLNYHEEKYGITRGMIEKSFAEYLKKFF